MKKLFLIFSLIFLSFSIFAQEVQFIAKASSVVELNEAFQLSFSVNANGSGFKAPNLSPFRASGPSTSSSSSYQFINGKTQQSVQNAFVYYMQPTKVGKFTIGSAEITVNGKVYKTNPISIEVVSGSSGNNSNTTPNTSSNTSTESTEQTGNEKGDIFVTVSLSKTSVYQGESLNASVKIYTRESLSGFQDIKLPSYQGFWSQEIPTANNIQLERVNYNGKVYSMGVLNKSLLFPQRIGTITVDPANIEAVIRKETGRRSFWGPSYSEVVVKLKSSAEKVIVKPLPEGAPASFNGAVGDFTFTAEFDKTQMKANDAARLKITISGNGNLKLIDPLKVIFPPDFEVYDPQITNDIKNTVGGAKGSTTIEYVVIPRVAGEFSIPALEFSYFDPNKQRYITLKSKDFNFKIDKSADGETGNGNDAVSFTKKDVQLMGTDIRHIKENKFSIAKVGIPFYGSFNFYASYIILSILFLVVFFIRRKQVQRNSDIANVKNRRASKISQKRLKLANKFLTENKKEPFYDEILKASWGYVSDKLNIPNSQLSRDTILETFKTKNIDPELSAKFIKVLDECEFAKYSPAGQADMQQVYKSASEVIQAMEGSF